MRNLWQRKACIMIWQGRGEQFSSISDKKIYKRQSKKTAFSWKIIYKKYYSSINLMFEGLILVFELLLI